MLVDMKDVKKSYSGFQLDCSLQLLEGRVTGLVGQNGAGKTTVFKSILNLISIDSGSVSVLDKDYKEITNEDRKKIAAVLSGSGFHESLNIKDIANIQAAMYEKFDKAKFLEKCQSANLPLSKMTKEFSTGMRAKLKVLIATSYDAQFLILDEPTAGLDVIARDSVLDSLREYIAEDEQRGILISSHISGDLESICDDIYMIENGEIILHEDTDRILGMYGLIKIDEKDYSKLDKKYLMRVKKDKYNCVCLTNRKQYYMDNYPGIVIEKGSVDNIITMMIKGDAV